MEDQKEKVLYEDQEMKCCVGCLSSENLCNLFGEGENNAGKTYAEKLENCFNIKVHKIFRYICLNCITDLETATEVKVRYMETTGIKNENEVDKEYEEEYLDEVILQEESPTQDKTQSEAAVEENEDVKYEIMDEDEENIQTLDDTVCIYCEVQLSSAEEVHEHIRVTHGLEPKTGEPLKECPLCDVAMDDFNAHVFKCHPTPEAKDIKRVFQCHFCDNVYKNRKACFTHLRMKHGVKLYNNQAVPRPTTRERVKCHLCDRDFSQKQILNKHLLKAHGFEVQKRKAFVCPLCSERVSYGNHFSSHLLHHHGVHQEIAELEFSSIDEFMIYKNAIQEETKYRFRKTTASKRTVEGIRSHFMCSQSGVYVYQGKGKRPAPERQIYKTGNACPAHMIVTETMEKVLVTFYQTHVGHGPCPYYEARLPKRSKTSTITSLMVDDEGISENEHKEDDDKMNSLAWICDTCGMGFLQVEQFKAHITSHDPKLCPCQYCDSVFDNLEAWTHHIQEHTGANIVYTMD